ncbi:MAG: PEPxxWA-CTERM sorting domain-containing protein [Proteobacteria bacterium]|nr:PEPxxWA-CTERM sorting domain-containing protein [Pseudomonadota bacterium]
MTALLGLGVASRAWSAVLLDDNFDGETVPAGGWVMNDTSFTNFIVSAGSVDLLTGGNPFGLVGSGTNSSGNFVDLDGSTFAGGTLQTKATYSFNAGDTVTLSIDVGGNQRSGTDGLFAGFSFVGSPSIGSFSTSGLGAPVQPPNMLMGMTSLASTDPFQVLTISFVAQSAGGLTAFVGTDSADNMGPLLDRVTLSDLAADVPEPQAWMLMIVGFGGLGALLRRRRLAVA